MRQQQQMVSVEALRQRGVLRVEDGNHGEYRPRPYEFANEGTAFIRASDLSDGGVLFDSCSKINETARNRITKGIGSPGDILLSHKGTVGKLSLVPDEAPAFVCSPQTTFWRTLNENVLDRRYLYAFMRSSLFRQQLDSRAQETDMAPYVSLTAQRTFSVLLPHIREQRAIAAILGALDDKIELNRKMNETLEQMAQAIFKSWFIDFDGHTEFEVSELGRIPKEWSVGNIDGATSLIIDHRGKTPKKLGGDWATEGVQALSAKNVKDGLIVREDTIKFLPHALYRRWMPQETQVGDILLTSEAPLGELYMVLDDPAYCLSQRLYALRANGSSCLAPYLYFWLRSQVAQDEMAGRATGTTVVGIRQSELRKLRVLLPPDDEQAKFSKAAVPLLQRARACQRESRTLADLRDALLPPLISGELRIKDAEKLANQVA